MKKRTFIINGKFAGSCLRACSQKKQEAKGMKIVTSFTQSMPWSKRYQGT